MFHVNQKSNVGVKRLTMFLQYHGLSRIGIQTLAFKGVCVNIRTADRQASKTIAQQTQTVITLFREGKAIIGMDNYNHAYGSPIVSFERKAQLSIANYTACGISRTVTHIDDLFRVNESEEYLPSIPERKVALDAFVRSACANIEAEIQNIQTLTGGMDYWQLSTVVLDSLGAVPLRPDNKLQHTAPRGRQHYTPWFVTGRNCASNIGILHVLTTIFNEYQHLHALNMYGYIKADVSIYIKYLQVSHSFVLIVMAHRSCTRPTAPSTAIASCCVQSWSTSIRSSTLWRVSGRKIYCCGRSSRRFCIISCQTPECAGHQSCSWYTCLHWCNFF